MTKIKRQGRKRGGALHSGHGREKRRKIGMVWGVSDLTCLDDVFCLLLVCGGEKRKNIPRGEEGSKAKGKSAGGQNQSKIKEETAVGQDER